MFGSQLSRQFMQQPLLHVQQRLDSYWHSRHACELVAEDRLEGFGFGKQNFVNGTVVARR